MKRNALLFFCLFIFCEIFSQIKSDTLFYQDWGLKYESLIYESYLNDKLIASIEMSRNPNGDVRSFSKKFFLLNGQIDCVYFSWTINYDTILLDGFYKSNDKVGIVETYYFYQDARRKDNIGSVKIHKYYKNGKKIRKEYAAGEKWADLPYDPDSLFFELPKMLKLGDSILRVKHKYPRPD